MESGDCKIVQALLVQPVCPDLSETAVKPDFYWGLLAFSSLSAIPLEECCITTPGLLLLL